MLLYDDTDDVQSMGVTTFRTLYGSSFVTVVFNNTRLGVIVVVDTGGRKRFFGVFNTDDGDDDNVIDGNNRSSLLSSSVPPLMTP